jgi:hypothetical protein
MSPVRDAQCGATWTWAKLCRVRNVCSEVPARRQYELTLYSHPMCRQAPLAVGAIFISKMVIAHPSPWSDAFRPNGMAW